VRGEAIPRTVQPKDAPEVERVRAERDKRLALGETAPGHPRLVDRRTPREPCPDAGERVRAPSRERVPADRPGFRRYRLDPDEGR
jgi:hypothetical protein